VSESANDIARDIDEAHTLQGGCASKAYLVIYR